MVRFIKECVGCTDIGLPCMGYGCTQGYMEIKCDWCDCDADELYKYYGDEICRDCLLGDLDKQEETEEYEETFFVNGQWLVDVDALGEFEKIEF